MALSFVNIFKKEDAERRAKKGWARRGRYLLRVLFVNRSLKLTPG